MDYVRLRAQAEVTKETKSISKSIIAAVCGCGCVYLCGCLAKNVCERL